MKKNIKGFTLIELLAVIVVLAIIALIATPIVLNMIDDAREGASKSSAYAYINAVENAVLSTLVTDTSADFIATYTVGSTGKTLTTTTEGKVTPITVDIKGDLPATDSVVTVGSDGSISSATLTINNHTWTYNGSTLSKASS